jgi:hypothetical protein
MSAFRQADEWLRALLAPPSADAPSEAELGRAQKVLTVALAFIGSLLAAYLLFGMLILLAILISFAIAASAPRIRRRYLLIGVSLALPIELLVWYFFLGVH